MWERRFTLIGTAALLAVMSLPASAKATWFDSATGQPVHVTPRGNFGSDENHATIHDLEGHIRDLYWDGACNTWRDSATGGELHVTPRGNIGSDENHATIHDLEGHIRNLYWVPCPPPAQPGQTMGPPSVPILPGIGFGFGIGRGHRGDDRR
jgi:hypothetical protein